MSEPLSLLNSDWAVWQSYLAQALKAKKDIDGADAAEIVRQHVAKFWGRRPKSADVVSKAITCLGIGVEDEVIDIPPSTGRFWINQSRDAIRDRPQIALGVINQSRRRFILAHELGHAVLYSIAINEHAPDSFRARYAYEIEREVFCNRFAAALLLSKRKILSLDKQYAENALYSGEEACAIDVMERSGTALTFYHIRALARVCRVSVRLMISALHKHDLLSHTQVAIAVMRVGRNRYTGLEQGLRIWQVACPAWGHVNVNQRVGRQGFIAAQEAYKTLNSNKTVVRDEQLYLSHRREQGLTRWQKARLATRCAYTAVDVADEGRYLVAIWKWNKELEG